MRASAIDAGERQPGGLQRAQTAQGIEGPCRRRYAGLSAGAERHPSQRGRAHASRGAGGRRCRQVTGEHVEIAYVDQGYTGPDAAAERRRSTASSWWWSRRQRPNAASCCCPSAGWWSAASPGWPASAAWPATTSVCPQSDGPAFPGLRLSHAPSAHPFVLKFRLGGYFLAVMLRQTAMIGRAGTRESPRRPDRSHARSQ